MIKKILIIDDELSICKILSQFLKRNGYATTVATCGKEALKLLKENQYDLILCDYNLGDIYGSEILEKIQRNCPDTIIIFISGYGNIPTAVNLVKGGAYQFLTKPLYPDLILKTIENAFIEKETKRDTLLQEKADTSSHYIKGESEAARKLFEYVNLVAPSDYSVIIHGETGTGKEALARFLHKGSKRQNHSFVAIDCGSLSRELAASELFGYKKGAFTGATQDKKGAFELANGGTIFLDEIGNIPYEVQMYLLRVLQEKMIRKVGSTQEQEVDVRIIVASNESLQDLVYKKQFREDLYHRLNEFTLEVPPLRERKEDLKLFVDNFIKQASVQLGKKVKGLSKDVWELFQTYHWPGNIRELQNVIKRACLLTPPGNIINEKSLPLEILEPVYDRLNNDQKAGISNNKASGNSTTDLKETTLAAERDKILTVLKEVNYNKSKAAALLNIDRKTLYNKLKDMKSYNNNLQY